jgi:hypothetical protein
LRDKTHDIDVKNEKKARDVLENPSVKLMDPQLTKMILEECEIEEVEGRKEAVIQTFLTFTWNQRLYFIVRSALMGLIGAILMAAIVYLIGRVDAIQVAFIGVASFIFSLVITRLFDNSVTQVSSKLVSVLSNHRRIRVVIIRNF